MNFPMTGDTMQAALRLSLKFDPSGLKADVGRLIDNDWIDHFNTAIYSGDWSGLALRGPAGATHPIQALHSAPGTTEFEDQPPLLLCPHLQQVIQTLPCEPTAVRLLRLGPGAQIAEHTDHELGYDFGEVRLHVPIITSPEVEFRVEGRRVEMRPGEVWYIDASRPHAVTNHGDRERIHLVLDCPLNDWLRMEFQQADAGHTKTTPHCPHQEKTAS